MAASQQGPSVPSRTFARRGLLQAGVAGVTGLSLTDLLRAAPGRRQGSARSIINVHLDGGPPQMDFIDMKPDGPSEVRGEFAPISTAVPGIQVCELLPGIARLADRFAFIRALVGSVGQHDAFQCQSGYDAKELQSQGGWPAVGCVVGSFRGTPTDPVPPFIDLMQGRGLARNSARAGFLGPAHAPFRPDIGGLFTRPLEAGMQRELAALGADHATSLALAPGMTIDRLGDRRGLLRALDGLRADFGSRAAMGAVDRFHDQAVGILTSGKVAEALDISRESPQTLERYRFRGGPQPRFTTHDEPQATLKFLLARRMVEAGVRCVSISLSDFDTHADNFPRLRQLLPILDTGLTALVTDLEERGMLDEVVIVVWGEFGRTPKINTKGGRDHWPAVSPALLVGGGIRGGQVIGETDRWAAEATGGAVSFQDVCATLYQALGFDPTAPGLLTDATGRPHALVERGHAIAGLL